METTTSIIPITCDLIRDLRQSGKGAEATELLNAHYKDVKKAGQDAANDYEKVVYRVKKHFGVCYVQGCKNKASENHGCCKHHLKYFRDFEFKKRQKNSISSTNRK